MPASAAPPPKLDVATQKLALTIGASIADARRRADVSQQKLADGIGMTRSNFARIEQGRTNVTIDTLLRIARGLGLTVDVRFVPVAAHDAPAKATPANVTYRMPPPTLLTLADSAQPPRSPTPTRKRPATRKPH